MDALGKGEQLFSDLSEQDPQVINRMLTCLSVYLFVCLSDYQSFPQLSPQELAPYLLPDIKEQIEQAANDVENAKNMMNKSEVDLKKFEVDLKKSIADAEKNALAMANGLKTEMQKDIKQAVTVAKQALQSKVDTAAQGCTHLLSYTPVYIYSLTHIFYTYFITQM